MNRKSKKFLYLQNFSGRITILIIAPLYYFMVMIFFYRVRDLKEIRRRCAAEFADHKGGWMICSNHLTMVDSLQIINRLARMEEKYFALRRERCCGFEGTSE